MTRPLVVVDASAGAKWYKAENGSEEALALLDRHAEGQIDIHMPEQCVGEVLAVVARSADASAAVRAWVALDMTGIERHGFSDELLHEARRQMALLGCVFYDALAPALASLLGAELCSADRAAHARYPGVRLLGSA